MLTPRTEGGFGARRVVVVGDALLDRFTETRRVRRCREGPGPIVGLERVRSCPGGAANVAANLATLGASVELVSVIGDDPAGRELSAVLTGLGVGLGSVVVSGTWSTPVLNRVRVDGELLARVDEGSADEVCEDIAYQVAGSLDDATAVADALIVSDYARGTVVDSVLDAVTRLSADGGLVAVDAHRLVRYRSVRPTVVKPNWPELVSLLGHRQLGGSSGRVECIVRRGWSILALTGARIAAVTLDREGAVVVERWKSPHRTFARPTTEDRATGAGDTFLAALTLGLASGFTTPTAAELASAAAGVVTRDPFTSQCSAGALAAAVSTEAALGVDDHARGGQAVGSSPAMSGRS